MMWCYNFIMWFGFIVMLVLRLLSCSLCSCHDVMWLRCYVVWYLRSVVSSLCLLDLTYQALVPRLTRYHELVRPVFRSVPVPSLPRC